MAPAEIRSYDDLLAAARQRKAELNLTYEAIDEIAGLQSGYSAKLIGPRPARRFGITSLPLVLGALGLRFAVVDDPEQITRLQRRLDAGKRRIARPAVAHWRTRRAETAEQQKIQRA